MFIGKNLIKKLLQPLCFIALFTQGTLASDYTFSCWENGWRKNANDRSKDLFAIETNHYGFKINVINFDELNFGRIVGQPSYLEALTHKTEKLRSLPKAKLLVAIEVDGKRYTAKTRIPQKVPRFKRLSSVRLWESGRFVQHYDFLHLDFRDSDNKPLDCEARLDLVAWPSSLTFTLHVTPPKDWTESALHLRLKGKPGDWNQRKRMPALWKAGEERSVTITSSILDAAPSKPPEISVVSSDGKKLPVQFDPQKNCQVASVSRLKRSWKTGYTDIRNYDDFKISIAGSSITQNIPFLLHLRNPANITGICPILCHEDGTPTGIPIQLSKNWHYKPMGNYLMAYAMLPPRPANYILRLAYGFYGSLPSASHAQLSLVGYGGPHAGNGRWDQLAIGCWGETICFDMDMSLVDIAITDIRMLMTRQGLEGKKWGWTDAGWGGDWLKISDQNQKKYFQNNLKTAYLAHGPCLTEARHAGYYGANQEVEFSAKIQTLRTDDYSRTFQRLRYTFTKDVSAKDIWLYKIGRSFSYHSPRVAYGNLNGLLAEHQAPDTLNKDQLFLNHTELTGPAPHWIAFPGAHETREARSPKPNGYRALVIRNYKAVIGGMTYRTPVFRSPVHRANPTTLDIEILPPDGLRQFQKGDQIDLDIELITLPRLADDYYGPNETFRQHLAKHPSSWKTTHREAKGNTLRVQVSGGTETQNYPLVIQVEEPEVKFTIQGGIGAVPVQFKGLKTAGHYQLHRVINGKIHPFNQSVHGNDFWQTDFDPNAATYSLTFNLPLDGINSSEWILRKTSK
ncbi:MAG: hypothetical protein ABF334_04315 [Akkermansiaceae bacterium]